MRVVNTISFAILVLLLPRLASGDQIGAGVRLAGSAPSDNFVDDETRLSGEQDEGPEPVLEIAWDLGGNPLPTAPPKSEHRLSKWVRGVRRLVLWGDTPPPTAAPTFPPPPTPNPTPNPTDPHWPGEPSTPSPTGRPTRSPTRRPTRHPTQIPTSSPTQRPTSSPTQSSPTQRPTRTPTLVPSLVPSSVPTKGTSAVPSEAPSEAPSLQLSAPLPSALPSQMPSVLPTESLPEPSVLPSAKPSVEPSMFLSSSPSLSPSTSPSSLSFLPTSVLVQDNFFVSLQSVSGPMSSSTRDAFLNEVDVFLSDNLALLEQPITLANVQQIQQSWGSRRQPQRKLQSLSPLLLELGVTGTFVPVPGKWEMPEDVNLGEICANIFNTQPNVFLMQLRNMDNPDDAAYFSNVESLEAAVQPPNGNNDDDGLSTGVLVGIIVGSGAAVLVGIGLIYTYSKKLNFNKGGERRSDASSWGTTAPATASAAERQSRFRDTVPSGASQQQYLPPVKEEQAAGKSQELKRVPSEDLSYLQSNVQSNLGGGESIAAMSYAYSLDHGIDQQSVVSNMPWGQGKDDMHLQVACNAKRDDNIEIDPMPLSAAAATGGTITRECYAPPGKLGLVIDTTLQGPVVHKVHRGSPLEGVVWPGDLIVKVDDTDCRTMSAAAMAALMAETADKRRKLTIFSDAS